MSERGVVAAGHPLTAEVGAGILREGGNAADAAVAAMLAACVCESPLTGLSAGGYMLLHGFEQRDALLDFFVAVPGLDGRERTAELEAVPIWFTSETAQDFYVGAASCAVPGVPAGLELAAERYGTASLADLCEPAIGLARDGVELNRQQAYILDLLGPILVRSPEGERMYAPGGGLLGAGERIVLSELGESIELFAAEGSAPFYRGDVAAATVEAVEAGGGTLGPADLESYEPLAREPVRASFAGCEVLTNPPPSAGGVLIALALEVLARAGGAGPRELASAMEEAQAVRGREFVEALEAEGLEAAVLAAGRLDAAGARVRRGERAPGPGEEPLGILGSTTHITAVDGEGRCASVTCSNGSGSGLYVPGTGIQVNNMLGEEDLNPLGFHRLAPGRRMPSMMAPTAILEGGGLRAALGSGGSNRIRSAIVQVVAGLLAGGLGVREAVEAPRLHCELGVVHAEPGIDARALARLESVGFRVERWRDRNLFFGGVHAVERDPLTGALAGAGDPRRGGAVAVA